tara:strand:+ start:157 stop:294 length:138 start_codon:yes stop_codon:yes gene_type:complete
MNLIYENTKEIDWFTGLREIQRWMKINLEDYDWYFSNVDGGWTQL